MRTAALGLEGRLLLRCQSQCGAVIDRRQTARQLALAAAVEFIRRLVTRIKPAHRPQLVGSGVIQRKTRRLGMDLVWLDAKPIEVGSDAARKFVC